MNSCILCKRFIASDSTRQVCDVCFEQYDMEIGFIEDAIEIHGLTSPEQIAAHTHIPLERVHQLLLSKQNLAHEILGDEICSKCRKKPAMTHSRYCLGCQLALFKNLGDEARTVAKHPYIPDPKSRPKGLSAKEELAQKRNRAGFNRFDPSIKSIKGTGGK